MKIGIDKRKFDDQIKSTTNCVLYIENYLLHSGDAAFYKVVTSKLLEYTIGIIGDRVVAGINNKAKYETLLKAIDANRGLLKGATLEKLDSLLNS